MAPNSSSSESAGEGFGQLFGDKGSTAGPPGAPPGVSGVGQHLSAGNTGGGAAASPNLGFVRKTGRRRVIGGASTPRAPGGDVLKSYTVAQGLQFTDVEELRSDAISRNFAQEILERLWDMWGLDTKVAEVMKKAEDVVFALLAMRTASPDADYDVVVLLGNKEVNLNDLSSLLASEEVTRRRFARAVADDIRNYIAEPDNVRLRSMLVTELGVKEEYVTLAFDGSTHCSGMSTNQVMFTKSLEQRNLFDQPEVRDRMGSTQQLATAGFQVNRNRGAYS